MPTRTGSGRVMAIQIGAKATEKSTQTNELEPAARALELSNLLLKVDLLTRRMRPKVPSDSVRFREKHQLDWMASRLSSLLMMRAIVSCERSFDRLTSAGSEGAHCTQREKMLEKRLYGRRLYFLSSLANQLDRPHCECERATEPRKRANREKVAGSWDFTLEIGKLVAKPRLAS